MRNFGIILTLDTHNFWHIHNFSPLGKTQKAMPIAGTEKRSWLAMT